MATNINVIYFKWQSAQSAHRNHYSEENEKTTENYSQCLAGSVRKEWQSVTKTSGEEICVHPHECNKLQPKQSCFRLFQSAVKSKEPSALPDAAEGR